MNLNYEYFGEGTQELQLALTQFDTRKLAAMKQPFLNAIDEVWNWNESKPMYFSESLFGAYNKQLLPSVQGNHTDYTQAMLQNNVSRFAGWKTNAVVKQLLDAKNAAGTNKAAYEVVAKSVINTHGSYLGAEYQAALRRNNSALQWTQFQKEKHLYPNIMWLPSRSAKPDIVHKGYWNRVWPMGDDFFNTNQPGNRWGCKCSWKTTDLPANNDGVLKIDAAKGLDNNPGKSNEIFTDSHPYYTNASTLWIKDAGPLRNVDSVCYVPMETKKGSKYLAHYNKIGKTQSKDTFIVAETLADLGYDVILLPEIKNDLALRDRYLGRNYIEKFPKESPDSFVNGTITELKLCVLNKLTTRINDATYQSDTIIVQLKNSTSLEYIKRKILPDCYTDKIKSLKIIIDGIIHPII